MESASLNSTAGIFATPNAPCWIVESWVVERTVEVSPVVQYEVEAPMVQPETSTCNVTQPVNISTIVSLPE